jgi:hypothetical protein
MAHGESETDGRAVVEDVDRETVKPDDLGKALNDASDSVERVGELVAAGMSGWPNPGRSGATMRKRSARSGIKSRNMCPALGKPCSSRSFGPSGAPASR